MKIVHICMAGPVSDGWSYQDNLLTKYHRKMGFEVTIITSKWAWNDKGILEYCDKSCYINSDGVKVIRLPIKGKEKFERKFKRYKGFYCSVEKEKPDILFIHNISFLDISLVNVYLKRHPDVIAYADNHSDASNSGINWLSRNILHKVIWRRLAKNIEPRIKKFYGVLPARVDWLKDMYGLPPEKCELLVMGGDDELVEKADEPKVRRKIRNKYQLLDSDFLIVTGGKIDPAKRQTLTLMQAVRELKDIRMKLVVFGSVDKSMAKEFNSLVDNQRVFYAGWCNQRESYEIFSGADLVCFPGRHSVYWEQVVAQGIPMVCKYWKGTDHVNVNGNVVFLEDDSLETIKNVLKDVLGNPVKQCDLKKRAQEASRMFLYSTIAQRSIL